jgi:hypothetical protein
MNPFRKNVLVLFGAALLIAMSVGSALGAKPTSSDAAGPRGQAVSDFVHSLVSGDQEVTVDETPTDEAPADEDTTTEEDSAPADEDTANASTGGNAHGECVAAVAQSTDTGGDSDNHGGAVSLAARETCWEDATAAADTAADVQAEMTARETAAAARAAAKEARKADQAVAKETRKTELAAAVHGKSGTHGGGHGH